ncbi:ABC transporter ATP-binding protein [Haloferax sp. CBA1149]|uniref:Molybdate/tungstate import ATP-binding protein WtpC n=3 Tax=Haloferax TaxID=2251 RepID=A0A6G1Z6I3_9EURY|nr:ABC transporter ATP-binding protein [Haloferax sp. CBA1149]KAB1185456.1 ABC transporter ATP-binding protein [Haloferax sp. CBA1149]MRW82103.1 ATP-binding cassette domain-containing protein [Haloferax marinisediminis]
MSENAISIVSLEKSFSNEQVLKGVDFSIEPSELCVIVGPSGSGKSTLLKCIAGLVSFDRGEVLIDGASVGSIPVEKRDLGYVFQDFEERLFPHMTVGENVAFGLRQSEENFSDDAIQQKIDESLELLAITETKDTLPSELSGGQQQRVELARNLVRGCDIMLLDDPLADLDYKLQKRMELEIRRIHETLGSTFVYVTHNQDQALKLADKLVVINQGMIEQIGTPDEVYQNPATAFVGRFIGDSDPLLGEVVGTDGANVRVDTPVGEIVAKPRGDTPDVGTEVMILVRPEDITIGQGTAELDNDLPATVQGRTYTGERTEFTVRLDGDAEDFQVVVSGNVPLEAFGNRTRIGWNADEGVAYDTLSVVETVTVDDLMEV